MRKMLVAAALAAAVALPVSTAQAGLGEGKEYVGLGTGDVTMVCGESGLPGIGGDCFDVPSGAVLVIVDVVDALSDNVGFRVGFYGAAGRIGDLQAGCNGGGFDVPGDATLMRVFVDGVLNAAADCETSLPDGVGTIGAIGTFWAVGL